jgi:hypothetical protein
MKSEIAAKLKEILDKMSQEEFDKEWSEITALNLKGPTFDQAIEYFAMMPADFGHFEFNTKASVEFSGDNYKFAA